MSSTWLILLGSLAAVIALLVVAAVLLFAHRDSDHVALAKRVGRLSVRKKARLAIALARDKRIPIAVRTIPPALVLYLAMPVDIIPDFIPVLGQLDDLLVVALGMGLLVRFTPREALLDHVERLEAAHLAKEA